MSNGLNLVIPKGRIVQNVSSGLDPAIPKGMIVHNVSRGLDLEKFQELQPGFSFSATYGLMPKPHHACTLKN